MNCISAVKLTNTKKMQRLHYLLLPKTAGLCVAVCQILLVLLQTISSTVGDVYFHNPRGSNNRLDEDTRERQNGNRMFDSQNNNRGGYNVGSLYYYTGSTLSLEWTNQHSCDSPNSHCEIILQYTCADSLRDGLTTSTVPEDHEDCENYDCNNDFRYGMHEDFEYYRQCKLRMRNKGLFVADQKLRNRNSARNTRQNAKGTRYGYECPEERDYYPYWHPSPWKDIAVLTNDATRCPYFQKESENVMGRGQCVVPPQVLHEMIQDDRIGELPNNEADCKKFSWMRDDTTEEGKGEWREMSSHGLSTPECRETEFTRDNHLGNGIDGYPVLYNWTVPNMPHEYCAFRIRYNISTDDYDGWSPAVNSSMNGEVNLGSRYNLSNEAADARGYLLVNNPSIQVFSGRDLGMDLAVNTAQFGRTFQDRSHTFAIRRRPDVIGKDAVIHNLNVRGKRGNIVQVYPAVEYDFVPNTLQTTVNDYIHFQWTGSNTNPNNNDGQGKEGTDRSNIVLQRFLTRGSDDSLVKTANVFGHWAVSFPIHLSNATFLGLTMQDKTNLAILQNNQFRGEMSELDDAGTYFDLGAQKVTTTGTCHYMCTRNNNFSNRSQKGRIISGNIVIATQAIGWNGGNVSIPGSAAVVKVSQGTFDKLQTLRVEEWPLDMAERNLEEQNSVVPADEYKSKFIVIYPEESLTENNKKMQVDMSVSDASSMEDLYVYRSTTPYFVSWQKYEIQSMQDGKVSFQTDRGGVYVVRGHTSVAFVVGVVVVVVVLLLLISATLFFFKKYPEKLPTSCRRNK